MIRNGSKLRGEGVIANQAVLGKNICEDAKMWLIGIIRQIFKKIFTSGERESYLEIA